MGSAVLYVRWVFECVRMEATERISSGGNGFQLHFPSRINMTRTVTSEADGAFTDTYTADAVGSWSGKSSWLGWGTYSNETHEECESPRISFTVQQEPT